jgi:hypothetical protein
VPRLVLVPLDLSDSGNILELFAYVLGLQVVEVKESELRELLVRLAAAESRLRDDLGLGLKSNVEAENGGKLAHAADVTGLHAGEDAGLIALHRPVGLKAADPLDGGMGADPQGRPNPSEDATTEGYWRAKGHYPGGFGAALVQWEAAARRQLALVQLAPGALAKPAQKVSQV